MKLIGSRTSPFVRKVRVILAERRLPFDFIEESAWTAETTVPRYNPLNKVPALVMDDGEPIYDSAVICEYLDAISAAPCCRRHGGGARGGVTAVRGLGDGIAEPHHVFIEPSARPRARIRVVARNCTRSTRDLAALERGWARGLPGGD